MSKRLSKLPAIAAMCVLGIALAILLYRMRDFAHPFGVLGAYGERSLREQDNRFLYMRKLTARDRSEFGEISIQYHILWWGVAEPCPDAVEAHRVFFLVTKGETLPRMTVILWMSREGTVFRAAVVSHQKTKPPEWLTEFAQQSLGKKRLEVPSLLQRGGLWALANSAEWLNSGRLRGGATLKLCEGADIFGYRGEVPGVYVLLDANGKVLEAVLFRS